MWSTPHRVGRSFDQAGVLPIDSVSDAHDMVCVVLATIDSPGDLVTTGATELGYHAESTALPTDFPITTDAAELGCHSGTFGSRMTETR